jgi:hypothetical protein
LGRVFISSYKMYKWNKAEEEEEEEEVEEEEWSIYISF